MLKSLFRKKEAINPEDELALWERNGKPSPPPHIVKQKAIDEYRKKFALTILVETGTFLGDMIYAHQYNFKKIYSIELGEKLHRRAKRRFRHAKHIELLQGDSGKVLHQLISELGAPALFWLDGHYSGGITALGDKECPVPEELNAILKSRFNHIILIDDARLFTGKNDYPGPDEIKSILLKSGKEFSMETKDDIIRITPNNQ